LQPHPEDPIRVGQAGRGIGAKGDLKLVAENQVLEGEVATGSEAGKKTAEQEAHKRKHPAG
jgi:hypothetical protein